MTVPAQTSKARMASISNPNSRAWRQFAGMANEGQPPQIIGVVLAAVPFAARRRGSKAFTC
jgi:hypothetical protein